MNRNKIKLLVVSLLLMALFASCGNSYNDFLLKYGREMQSVQEEDNRAGVFIEDISNISTSTMIRVGYKNPNINQVVENIDILSGRFFIADARTPQKELLVEIGKFNVSNTQYASDGSVKSSENYIVTTILCPEKVKKSDFVIVGFKGIDSTECIELATPPMFFLISFSDKNNPVNTSVHPTLVTDFFDATHTSEKFIMRTAKLNCASTDYHIGIYNIGKNENGKIVVEFIYESKDFFDGILNHLETGRGLPFDVEILVGGKTVKYNPRFRYTNGFLQLTFDTTEEPDKIFIIKDDQKLVFDGKTKIVLESY